MVEQVCTKQTSCFEGRLFAPVQPDSEQEPDNPFMTMMIGKKNNWHRPRLAASPFFSPNRLKNIVPMIDDKVKGVMELLDLEEQKNQPFDVREPMQQYAMDVLCQVAFGIDLALLDPSKPNHVEGMKIFKEAREMVHNGVVQSPWIFRLISTLPEIQPLAKLLIHFVMKFSTGPLSPLHGLLELITSTVEQRKSGQVKKNDLLQLLYQATNFDADSENNKDAKFLNEGQLKTNTVMFLMSGYETTSTTLAYLSHTLAMHQEAQEKLYQEISMVYPDQSTELDFDTVMNKMPYLDAVVMETIRIYPEGINIINRFITQETTLRGYEIPKSLGSILVDVWSIHQDPELWGPVDPSQFHPERFLPDYQTSNRPRSAYLGFGIGPHHCIGMRYALLEIKMTIIRMLQRYRIEPESPDAPKRIPVKVELVMVPTGEVNLKLTRRPVAHGTEIEEKMTF